MIEKDTVRLLRECDAGIKMGVDSINEVMDRAKDENFRKLLNECKDGHEKLGDELRILLKDYEDEGKDPNIMAKSMSFMKTEMKMAVNDSDKTIADLMTEGCNMGIKSLSKYLNEYKAADEKSKDITKRLIALEEKLVQDIRCYL
jgi:hypothetical protein